MTSAPLGVVLVAYNSADVILDCLETLMAAAMTDGTDLRVVVVDNASPDDSVAAIRAWGAGEAPYAPPADLPFPHIPLPKPLPSGVPEILSSDANGGFAAGVNIGLKHLFADPAIDRVWILNPDSVVPSGTPAAFACHDPGPFALMGGRVTYYHKPDMIQIDGGTINKWTGVTGNLNLYKSFNLTPAPSESEFEFITGASMIVSRLYYQVAGPMAEDYFLYYEEVDWAMRRGSLPLAFAPSARIFHRTGTSIGSSRPGGSASTFSVYFKSRSRMNFIRRFFPGRLCIAWAYTFTKAAQYWLKGKKHEANAILLGARAAFPPESIVSKDFSEGIKKLGKF